MHLSSYSKLLASFVPRVNEKNQSYQFLTERHIQAVWFEQKYFKQLITVNFEPIQIISPGIWNLEAGPDFRKAHLKIGQKDFFGDIEIHLNDESWQQHQHHRDSRYDQVILHLSLWPSYSNLPINNSQGDPIAKSYLEPSLTIPIARLAHLIDLDLYPYKKFLGSGRCASELFNKLPSEQISTFFEKAADWRLSRKKNFYSVQLADPSTHIAAGIAVALGYKNNSDSFLRVFLELQNRLLANEEQKIAWLMGVTGFFKPYFAEKWGKSAYYCKLNSLYESHFANEQFHIQLHLNQIRPLNHPVRRIVALAKLQGDDRIIGLQSKMYDEWDRNWEKCASTGKWKIMLEQLLEWIPNYQDEYWNTHYLFEQEARKEHLTLMGADLKREIVINLFLPLIEAHVSEKGRHDEILAFQELYRWLPASKAGKRKYLIHRFFGDSPKGKLLNNAYAEQGAYQLHYDFCSHFESSCEGCPFVDRYKQLMKLD